MQCTPVTTYSIVHGYLSPQIKDLIGFFEAPNYALADCGLDMLTLQY
jgi:hypothetical protein